MPPISTILATADDLHDFAAKDKAAEELLPVILRRLVLATLDSATEIDFPTGKSINEGGWDGHVTCGKGNLFVPDGVSGWELTARDDKKAKADEDYTSRLGSGDAGLRMKTTFIHWNIRKWRERKKWAEERRAENNWLDVQAYDARDLETWLLTMPALHIWVSQIIRKRPLGVADIVSFWNDWSGTPANPLPPEVILRGYEKQQEALLNALKTNSPVLSLQWERKDLAVAFLAAVLTTGTEPTVEKLAARCVYVKTEEAFDELVAQHKDLILVPAFTPAQLGLARQNGHVVILPLGRDAERAGEIVLTGRRPSEVFDAMAAWEPNQDRRHQLAEKATRKFTSFYRSLIPPGTYEAPAWSTSENVPFLLLGRWDSRYAGDKEALGELSGRSGQSPGCVHPAGWHGADRG